MGQTKCPNAKLSLQGKTGVLYYEGYLRIPQDGTYTFFVRAISATFLRLHEAAVIDGAYKYEPGSELEGAVNLKAGLHPFRLYCEQKPTGKPRLDLEWEGPGIKRQPVPAAVFCQDRR